MFNKKIYKAVQTGYLRGWISRMDWQDYCQMILYRIMEENKDVLIRLKNI